MLFSGVNCVGVAFGGKYDNADDRENRGHRCDRGWCVFLFARRYMEKPGSGTRRGAVERNEALQRGHARRALGL